MKTTNVMNVRCYRSLFIFVIVVLLIFNCSSCSKEKRAKTTPILLVGVDGLDWKILLPLIKNNRLPNLAALMKSGRYGKLATIKPTISPVIWTSIATGKIPQKHGIKTFFSASPNGKLILANSRDRKTKAIWDIASDYKKRVYVIGWWMTFPVDKIAGIMVAQTNAMNKAISPEGRGVLKGTLVKGVENQVYPAQRQEKAMKILDEVNQGLPGLAKQIFGDFPYPLSGLSQRLWDNCQWAFRADETYRRIALDLAQNRPLPDLLCFYLGGIDVVSHRFWRYMRPGLYQHPPSSEEIANFGKVIKNYYVYADRLVGDLQKAYGPTSTLIIVSDHGLAPLNLNGAYNSEDSLADNASAHHRSPIPGVFIAAGPAIAKPPLTNSLADLTGDELETVGSILDIAPTLLTMMEIPIGEDMDGKLMKSVFPDDFWVKNQVRSVPTHDTQAFFENRIQSTLDDPNREERLKQLRSLGYIGEEEEKRQ